MKWKEKKGKLSLFVIFVLLFSLVASSLAMAETIDANSQKEVIDTQAEETLLEESEDEPEVEPEEEDEPEVEPKEELGEETGIECEDEEIALEPELEKPASITPMNQIEGIETELAEPEKSTMSINDEDTSVLAVPDETASDIGIMATEDNPPLFTSHPDYFSAELDGTSTNGHTEAQLIWVGTDSYIYVAVNSTHKLEYMKIGNENKQYEPVYVYPEIGNNPSESQLKLASIIVDGASYSPTMNLTGNTKDSHWTIFQFPMSVIEEDGTYNFFIKGTGGGHDIEDEYTVQIPKIAANLTKYWIGGNSEPVVFELYRTTDNPESEEAIWKLVPSDEEGTITLDPLPVDDTVEDAPEGTTYYADYFWEELAFADTGTLKRYSYKVIEENPGPGYEATLKEEDYNDETRTYTFVVVNDYTIPIEDVTATKIWIGGEDVRPDLWFQLWRTTYLGVDEIADEVTPQKLPTTDDSVNVTFQNIQQTDSNGNEYTFFVKEGIYDGETFTEDVPTDFEQTGDGLELTNTYLRPGKITITKTVDNSKSVDEDKEYDIFIYGPDGIEYVVSLKNQEKVTLENLYLGEYEVRETVPMNYELVEIINSNITLTSESLEGSSTVINKPDNDGWFYDDDTRINTFAGVVIKTVQNVVASIVDFIVGPWLA
jgi:hypothetical protein